MSTITKSSVADLLNKTGVSGIFRVAALASTMAENMMEDLEEGQKLDKPLKLAEREIKRLERAKDIADMKSEMDSRMAAAQVQRKLASVNAAIELSKTELDLAVAESKHDRLKIFNDTSIPMAQKMIMINAIQTSITAKIAAYNALFQESTALADVTVPVATTTVDMSAYEDFSTVSDTDDVNL